jgi:hypothetical protein
MEALKGLQMQNSILQACGGDRIGNVGFASLRVKRFEESVHA